MSEVTNEFGVNIWWHIPTFTVNGYRAQGLLEEAGFEADELPLPSKKLAVSRTAYSFQDRRHKDGRRVTEKANDKGEYVVYGILGKTQKDVDEVGYDQATTIKLHKDSGSVTAHGKLGDEFLARLSKYETSLTNEDIAQFLRNLIKKTYGVPLRPTGGIYFVPNRFVDIIADAQTFLDSLGIGAKLYVQRIYDGKNEREIVRDSVENNIISQIESTLKAVDKIEKRVSSIENHETKLGEIEELMSIYQDLLGEEAKYEEITEQLAEASNHVAGKLKELQKKVVVTHNPVVPEAKKILKAAGKVMNFNEIALELKKNGVALKTTKTRSEAEWVSHEISRSLKKGYKGIERAGRGKFVAN